MKELSSLLPFIFMMTVYRILLLDIAMWLNVTQYSTCRVLACSNTAVQVTLPIQICTVCQSTCDLFLDSVPLTLGMPGLERWFSHPTKTSIRQMLFITNKA